MREEYVDIIKKFNISPTASKVYLTLIEIGKSTADKIAKHLGTYKPNVYDALNKLIALGMVTFIIEGKKKFYLATNPENLNSMIEEMKQNEIVHFEELKKDMEKIMPQLSAKYKSLKEKDTFEIYRGKTGYKHLILEIIKEGPTYWKGFGNLQVQETFPYNFQNWFKNVKFRLFSTKSLETMNRLKEARKYANVKIIWVPEELQMPIVWTVFGNNLLIIIYEPDIIILRIKSNQIVKTFSKQFDYLWKKHVKSN